MTGTWIRRGSQAAAALALAALAGCAGSETATVNFSYPVRAGKGLPPGMKQIAILPAKVTESTDPKWSDMSTTIMASLVNDSRSRFGTDVTVTERRDTKPVFDEADLAAAGMSTKKGGGGGQLMDADGYIVGKINVKTQVLAGRERTLSGLNLAGFGGHRSGGGRVDVQTEEVETVTRNMTVQTEFKLIDSSNAKVWEQFAPRTYSRSDRTKVNPIFGSSQTEAALTPQDKIIYVLVERGAREFISQLMPCRIDVEAEIVSSGNKNCVDGVRLLRAEAWDEAVSNFKAALNADGNDHAAAFGAGVASEASGNFDEALKFYNRACAGQENSSYREARDRVKMFGSRVQR